MSLGAICPEVCPLPFGVQTLRSTELPPIRRMLEPKRLNMPIRWLFDAVNR